MVAGWRTTVWLIVGLLLAGCGGLPLPATGPTLRIVSGSENQSLQPLIERFAQQERARIDVVYRGSVEIMVDLGQPTLAYDAVWPANSLWLELGDTRRRARYEKSIMRSPVVLGVKRSVAEGLGWLDRPVYVADILAAAEAGRLRFMMASASQTDAGATAYFGYLYAFAGNPEILTADDLRQPVVRERIKRILGSVSRSSGGSRLLKEIFLQQYDQFEAMVNYEALIIEANQALARDGREPLQAIYPVDGLAIADSPLAYLRRGDERQEALFLRLQDYLLSAPVQDEILRLGWRVGLIELEPAKADAAIFNRAWGVDLGRTLTPIRLPRAPVIREALQLYQTSLRRPSFTIWLLDFSGSMSSKGEQEVKAAMRLLLDQSRAGDYLLQATPGDVTIVIPFAGTPWPSREVSGNDASQLLGLADWINTLKASGGTDIYTPSIRALEMVKQQASVEHLPAVILMTDGRSEGNISALRQRREQLGLPGIPIHAILFGDADEKQLREIATLTGGQIFDGRTNLIEAFRTVKGNN